MTERRDLLTGFAHSSGFLSHVLVSLSTAAGVADGHVDAFSSGVAVIQLGEVAFIDD